MAEKIATYQAKDLKLEPSNTGYSAAEQAGRRIGPFAAQAAQAIRQVANLQAESDTAMGKVQAEFARLQGLEQEQAGVSVRTNPRAGPMSMFQLGAGGNEPNYAAANHAANPVERMRRVRELQEGPVAISAAARRIVNAQSPLTNTPQNGIDVLRGAAARRIVNAHSAGYSSTEIGIDVLRGAPSQSTDENGITTFRGASKVVGGPTYNDPTTQLLGQPTRRYVPPGSYNTDVIQGGPEGFGNGEKGTFNEAKGPLAYPPVTGGGLSVAPDVATEGLNANQWPSGGTPLPANNGYFGTSIGADQSENNVVPPVGPSGNQAGQVIPIIPAPGSAAPSAPTDPSQNPNAPLYWDNLKAGMSDPTAIDQYSGY